MKRSSLLHRRDSTPHRSRRGPPFYTEGVIQHASQVVKASVETLQHRQQGQAEPGTMAQHADTQSRGQPGSSKSPPTPTVIRPAHLYGHIAHERLLPRNPWPCSHTLSCSSRQTEQPRRTSGPWLHVSKTYAEHVGTTYAERV